MSLLTGLLRSAALLALALGALPGAMPPPAPTTLSSYPHGAEATFVRSIQRDLAVRFATAKAATRAGYFRYTNEDDTGAISYANLKWQSGDPRHPSQLWYDVHGNLLGADFSVLQSNSPKPPELWRVNGQRWVSFRAHIHYILGARNGTQTYGSTSIKKFVAAGGSLRAPKGQTLVQMGLATNVAGVKRVFVFPAIWDLIVWITPNPNGAFADQNPDVTPSRGAEKDPM
jgi:hypothetical protein